MTGKLLEAFFRHKLVLLLPVLLIPALVTPVALLLTPPYYEATVSVWVDRPAYLNYNDGSNAYVTPVQNHTVRLNELLKTRAFEDDVAQRTSLAPLVSTRAGEIRLNDLLTKGVTITGVGEHVLIVSFQAATAQLAYEVPQAILDAYQDKASADQAQQASVATDFYQSRVQDTQKQLSKSTQALQRYMSQQADSFDATTSNTPGQPGFAETILDPRLATLESSVQSAQKDATDAQTALKDAQKSAAAAVDGQQLGFQVLDAAQMPTEPTRPIKKVIVYPIAAVLSGLALSGMLLVLFVAGDRTVRSEADLGTGLRVLATVPVLSLKRVPKQLRPVATRRAIGVAAGASFPALGAPR